MTRETRRIENDEQPPAPAGEDRAAPQAATVEVEVIDARSLMRGASEIWLKLDEELYRLRVTSKRRLILTK